jgi:2-methylcitrate dehydratase PrpD
MTALEQLGTYLASGKSLPPSVLAIARLRLIDGVAAWIASIGTVEGRALIAFRRQMLEGAPPSERAYFAVATHCALARLSEIDDIHLASMTTAGGIVVPAALTLAASLGRSDPAGIARAIVGGYDALIRLGLAAHGPTILYRGIWPTYFGAAFGVAAVAARLMDLDERQAAHALALALTLAAPGVGHHNAPTTSRWLAVGLASRNGRMAAQAAAAGFTSDLNLLDSGFLPSVFDIKPDLDDLTRGLDQHFLLMDVSFKPWCAARQTMAATQALKDILARGIAPADIAEVEASVLPPHHRMIDHGVAAGDRASHLTSLPYQMAIAALTPEAAFDVAQSPATIPPPVAALMAKVKVTPNDRLLARYPKTWPAHVRVTTAAGNTHEQEVEHVPGDIRLPFDDTQVRDKFRRFTTPVLGGEGVARMLTLAAAALDQERAATELMNAIEQACAAVHTPSNSNPPGRLALV